MQRLGKDPGGREWYFADNQFTRPGVYYWNGERNVHAGDEIAALKGYVAELKTTLEARYADLSKESYEAGRKVDELHANLFTCNRDRQEQYEAAKRLAGELEAEQKRYNHLCQLKTRLETQSADEIARLKAELAKQQENFEHYRNLFDELNADRKDDRIEQLERQLKQEREESAEAHRLMESSDKQRDEYFTERNEARISLARLWNDVCEMAAGLYSHEDIRILAALSVLLDRRDEINKALGCASELPTTSKPKEAAETPAEASNPPAGRFTICHGVPFPVDEMPVCPVCKTNDHIRWIHDCSANPTPSEMVCEKCGANLQPA